MVWTRSAIGENTRNESAPIERGDFADDAGQLMATVTGVAHSLSRQRSRKLLKTGPNFSALTMNTSPHTLPALRTTARLALSRISWLLVRKASRRPLGSVPTTSRREQSSGSLTRLWLRLPAYSMMLDAWDRGPTLCQWFSLSCCRMRMGVSAPLGYFPL